MPASHDYLATLDSVIESTVAPTAAEVDRTGVFPRSSVEALAKAGLLGLISAPQVGGRGQGLPAAAEVMERLGSTCGSTAMVLLMHYAGTAGIEAHGSEDIRGAIARDEHLTTLAFSEAGSRSHFWAPLSSATSSNGEVRLDAQKSWVTSAGEADSYVWSRRPLGEPGPMTLWLVASHAPGLHVRCPRACP